MLIEPSSSTAPLVLARSNLDNVCTTTLVVYLAILDELNLGAEMYGTLVD